MGGYQRTMGGAAHLDTKVARGMESAFLHGSYYPGERLLSYQRTGVQITGALCMYEKLDSLLSAGLTCPVKGAMIVDWLCSSAG